MFSLYTFKSLTNVDSTSRSNSKDRLQESWGIGAENPHSGKPMLLEVVSQTSRSIRKFTISPAQDLVVGGYMINSLGLCNACQIQDNEYAPVDNELTLGSIAAARGRKKVGDNV